MKLFTIEDRLTNHSNNYIFFTENIDNFIKLSIFSSNSEKKILIKEVAKSLINIEDIEEEMKVFHNKILSTFFKALRNRDDKPEDSIKDIEFEQLNINSKDDSDDIKEYLDSIIDRKILAISISIEDKVILSINSNVEEDIEANISSVYNIMSSQEENIYRLIGESENSIFYYDNYSILYYKINNISMVITISKKLNLAKAIKISNLTRDKIIKHIS